MKKIITLLFITVISIDFAFAQIDFSPYPGNATHCPGEEKTYTASGSGCSAFTWTITNGKIIDQQNNNNEVTTYTGPTAIIKWNDTAGTGKLKVTSTCGTEVRVEEKSFAIASLAGRTLANPRANQTLLYCGTGTINLAVDIMYLNNTGAGTGVDQQRADGYEWSLPTGWNFSGGSSTETVNIYPDNGCRGGTVAVKAYMNCSSGKKYSSSSSISINRPTPTLTLSAPGLTASSCGSGQQVTFYVNSTNLPICIVDYKWVFSGPNASTPSGWLATPTSSGANGYITVQSSGGAADAGSVVVTATLSCGTQLVSQPLALAFASPAISTSPVICSGGTNVTMTNVAPSIAVNWSVSNNLNIVSGQGTSSAVISALNSTIAEAGSINATVGCANTNIAQKDVWVGVPQYTGNDVLSASPPVYCRPDYLGNNQLYMFGESSMLSVPGATGYNWRVFPNPPPNPYFQIVPNTGYLGATIVINSNAPTNQYLVIAEAINACGSGSGFSGFFEIAQRDGFGNCTSGGGGIEQFVFPNPTSDLITVSLSDNSEQTSSTIKSSEVALVDSQGINIYSLKTNESKLIIPVQHLNEGIYYLKVQTNGKTLQKQVVIKH